MLGVIRNEDEKVLAQDEKDVGPLWGKALGSVVPLVDEAMGPVEGHHT